MTTTKPFTHIPGPYGKPISVFKLDSMPDDGFAHDIDGCMDLAGIHDADARARCKAQIRSMSGRGGIPLEVFQDHGGRVVPKVPLIKPTEPIYPTLPRDMASDIPIETWVTLVMDHADWDERAAAVLHILADNIDHTRDWTIPPEVLAFGLAMLLTASLEHLVEPEIACLEAAALYALTSHPAWSRAGIEWLEPFRETWLADWIAERPAYREFAGLCRHIDTELPSWLCGRPA